MPSRARSASRSITAWPSASSPMMKVHTSMRSRAPSITCHSASRAASPSACSRISQRPGGARPKLSMRSAAQCPRAAVRGGRGEPAGRSLRWPNSRYIGRMM
nr:hypothetical protein [Variovorax paradoxus]